MMLDAPLPTTSTPLRSGAVFPAVEGGSRRGRRGWRSGRVAEQKGVEQKGAERKGAERKGAKQKGAEQKGAKRLSKRTSGITNEEGRVRTWKDGGGRGRTAARRETSIVELCWRRI
jgi:hypothetical protein